MKVINFNKIIINFPFVLDHTGQEATLAADIQSQDLIGPILMKDGIVVIRKEIVGNVIQVVGIVIKIVVCSPKGLLFLCLLYND